MSAYDAYVPTFSQDPSWGIPASGRGTADHVQQHADDLLIRLPATCCKKETVSPANLPAKLGISLDNAHPPL